MHKDIIISKNDDVIITNIAFTIKFNTCIIYYYFKLLLQYTKVPEKFTGKEIRSLTNWLLCQLVN